MAAERFRCRSCGNEFAEVEDASQCPSCDGGDLERLVETTFGSTTAGYRCADCGFEFEMPEEESAACPECESEDLERLVKTTFGSTTPCAAPGKSRGFS